MASFFNLTLDTTAPSNVSISLEGGAAYASQQLITATIGTTDGTTVGYQMLIWGDVDTTENVNIQASEGTSSWIAYSTSQQVKLSATDGSKTVYLKIRDDVYNPSGQASDSIILDTAVPVVTISGPDLSKISKQTGKNVSAFSFSVDKIFDEYKVKIVSSTGGAQDTGIQMGVVNGSTNMSGVAGSYAASTPINCQINGADLEIASAGDGTKIVKVFVRDAGNIWSV